MTRTASPPTAAPEGLPAPRATTAMRKAVRDWFRATQRALPWRDPYDPYGVWVAEIMLQQTQVAAVRPYYERWMARLPDVPAVAAAPEQEVLKLWEGLGYYARARNLRRAAQAMVAAHGGRVPATVDALLALPGIGRYTAGAIVSIGHNRPAPIVDGNVGRVLGRLVALEVPARSPPGQRRLWALAAHLVPRRDPRDFNQGLMELGALLCRPVRPQCTACPLRSRCRAHATGQPEAFPPPPPRRQRPERHGVLLLAEDSAGRVLLRQRPARGVWGGLWEPPWLEHRAHDTPATTLRRLLGEHALPADAAPVPAGTVTHGLTHFTLHLACYRLRLPAFRPGGLAPLSAAAHCWADAPARQSLPMSRLSRRALALRAP